MKKLLSVVAVAAIVTSAFAFTTNKTITFCLRNAAGNGCQLVNNKMIVVANGVLFKQYPLGVGQWDGTAAGCTGAGIANCSVDVRLEDN